MRTQTPLSQPGGGVSRRECGREGWATSVTVPARRRALPRDHPTGRDVVFVTGPSSEGWPGTSAAPIEDGSWRTRAAPRLCAASGGRPAAPEISGGRSRHFVLHGAVAGDIVATHGTATAGEVRAEGLPDGPRLHGDVRVLRSGRRGRIARHGGDGGGPGHQP